MILLRNVSGGFVAQSVVVSPRVNLCFRQSLWGRSGSCHRPHGSAGRFSSFHRQPCQAHFGGTQSIPILPTRREPPVVTTRGQLSVFSSSTEAMGVDSEYWILVDVSSGEVPFEFLDVVLRSVDAQSTLYLAVLTGLPTESLQDFPKLADLEPLYAILRLVALYAPRLKVTPIYDVLYNGSEVSSIKAPDVIHVSDVDPGASVSVEEFCARCWNIDHPIMKTKSFADTGLRPCRPVLDAIDRSLPDPSMYMLLPEGGVTPKIERGSRVVRYNTVAVGGTFDRFHAGHRLLLAVTAMVAKKAVFVGISSDKLLQNKNLKDKLEGYQDREHAAVSFMEVVNPALEVTPGPLTDPLVPPLCATEEAFDAIVVSEETISGAHEINRVRHDLGFKPLAIVVVGLLYHKDSCTKLSSSDLRNKDAAPS